MSSASASDVIDGEEGSADYIVSECFFSGKLRSDEVIVLPEIERQNHGS